MFSLFSISFYMWDLFGIIYPLLGPLAEVCVITSTLFLKYLLFSFSTESWFNLSSELYYFPGGCCPCYRLLAATLCVKRLACCSDTSSLFPAVFLNCFCIPQFCYDVSTCKFIFYLSCVDFLWSWIELFMCFVIFEKLLVIVSSNIAALKSFFRDTN